MMSDSGDSKHVKSEQKLKELKKKLKEPKNKESIDKK